MERLSALMDGELDPEHVARSLENACEDEHWRKNWQVYHVIGDCLRQDAHMSCDVSAAVMANLAQGPTVLAPRNVTRSGMHPRFMFALAASAAGVALVAWVAFMHNPLLTAPATVAIAPVGPMGNGGNLSLSRAGGTSEYLTAHQQVSPSSLMRGVAAYVNTVSADDTEAEHQ